MNARGDENRDDVVDVRMITRGRRGIYATLIIAFLLLSGGAVVLTLLQDKALDRIEFEV